MSDTAAAGARPQTSIHDRIIELAATWEAESHTLRQQHVDEGLHPALASGDRDANLILDRASQLRAALELPADEPGPAVEPSREDAMAMIARGCAILAGLGAELAPDLDEACLANLAALVFPGGIPAVPGGPAGQFMTIAFFGHIEHTGYVTEITFHGGEPGYRIDLPEKLWAGNPMAYREYAASAMFSRWPVDEASVRIAWKAEQERARKWREREAAWGSGPAALTAADDEDPGPVEG